MGDSHETRRKFLEKTVLAGAAAAIAGCTKTVVMTGADSTTVPPAVNSVGSYVVTSYGAVGDGNADDTLSIQTTIDAAFAARKSFKPAGSGSVYSDDISTIVFPAGRYKISGPLMIPSSARIEAVGSASIEPIGAFPILSALDAYQLHIQGIVFVGGTNSVLIKNNNTESAMIDFVNCEFKNCTSFAISATPITPSADISVNHLSTNLLIKNCKFHNVGRGVETWCDYTHVQDCWATWGDDLCISNTSFFVVRNGPTPITGNPEGGTLILDNFIGIPNMSDTKTTVRWIDNYWRVLCRRSRFGQEAAGGIPIVYNYAPYANTTPYAGGGVTFRDCELWAGGTNRADRGVICLQSEIPGLILFDGNFGPINVPFVRNIGISNLTTYLSAVTVPERSFHFHFGPNCPGTQPDPTPMGPLMVPALLLPWVTGEMWQAAAAINPVGVCQSGAAPNAAKSRKTRQINQGEQVVYLTGIIGPSGSNVLTAGSAIGALGDATHFPNRNLLLPIVGFNGVITYLQVLSNGTLITGQTLTGSSQTLQLDGVSYVLNN